MRVLMVSDVYFPRVNGVSTSIQTFRRDLAALGCETWLVTPDYPQGWSDDERVLRQPSRYLAFDPEDRMMKPRATLAACLSFAGRVDVCTSKRRSSRIGSGSRLRASCACRRSRRITRFSKSICTTTCRCCPLPSHARSLARSRAVNATPSTRSLRRRSSSPTCSSATASRARFTRFRRDSSLGRVRGRRRRAHFAAATASRRTAP